MDIIQWLRETSDDQDDQVSANYRLLHTRNRKGQHTRHVSPPPEDHQDQGPSRAATTAEVSTLKKRKTGHKILVSPDTGKTTESNANSARNDNDDIDDAASDCNNIDDNSPKDITPRPRRRPRLLNHGALSSASSYTQSSNRSGVSSPNKHLAAMSLSDFDFQDLADKTRQPRSLVAMCAHLKSLRRARGILGLSSQGMFHVDNLDPELAAEFATYSLDPDSFFSAKRDTTGPTPSPDDVQYILESAIECSNSQQAEPGWNNEVHHPLLALSLRQRRPGRTFKSLVKVMTCSTASLIHEYKPSDAPNKKIDYCICIDPKHDADNPDLSGLIDTIRAELPLLSINPTGEFALLERPLVIPIETKRPGEDWDGATLQESTWLAAQLELLQRLINMGKTTADEPSENDTAPSLQDIEFLPGLIIQGHDWAFVATTREGTRTVIWTKEIIGSTNDVTGIYQIVAFLHTLREWILVTYWPWLSRVIRRACDVNG